MYGLRQLVNIEGRKRYGDKRRMIDEKVGRKCLRRNVKKDRAEEGVKRGRARSRR